ncbi:MAG: hypothetical protein DRP78_04310 [Candidatus Omnitrophota bacterium]|nr:MAG: hypothetical protein DRP78_04310 [Candidatus Omnitrophota bacterium]
MLEKIIFLDRDGVINRNPETGYVDCLEKFEFLPGVIEAIKNLFVAGYKVIVVSNQAGVSKGLYTEQILETITINMQKQIEAGGGQISSVQYCVHGHNDGCVCRKPEIGLFTRAVKNIDIDFEHSFMIGDTERDIQAGFDFGCRTILLFCGKTKSKIDLSYFKLQPDFIARDLLDAVNNVILKNFKGL